MKRIFTIFFECALTIALIITALVFLTRLTENKSSYEKYEQFFAQEEDFDVLFLGTSRVLCGIYPMELYRDHGMISYNFGGNANRIPTTYWVMKNALDYTDPKLIVIDCSLLSGNYKTSDNRALVHISLDAFPLTVNKAKGVYDLLDDSYYERAKEGNDDRDPMEFIWDYSIYHNRWSELTEEDIEPSLNLEKGAGLRVAVADPLDSAVSDEVIGKNTVGQKYLKKMITECQERGIEVLLTYLPYPVDERRKREANTLPEIAEEYGVNYIDFLELGVVDYSVDMSDEDSHLNVSGARKVTDYLGTYIEEHYDIPDRRSDEAYSGWKDDLKIYDGYIARRVGKLNSIDNYLMMLYGYNKDVLIDIRDKSFYEEKHILPLLNSLGVNINEVTNDTDFIIIKNGGEKAAIINDSFESKTGILRTDSSGEYAIIKNNDGAVDVYENGKHIYTAPKEGDGVRFYMIDPETEQVVDDVWADFSIDPASGTFTEQSFARNN